MRSLTYVAVGFGVIIGVALLLPSPINSAATTPSTPQLLDGAYAPNDMLQSAQMTLLPAGVHGGEDVALDSKGCRYTGVDDGSILKLCTGGEEADRWQTVANTQGRPLGLAMTPSDELIIADGVRGLLKWAHEGTLQVLADHYQGEALGVVDDVDIGNDGTIYFSDASTHWPLAQYLNDALEARPSGRLFALKPSGELILLADDLAFANGVAVSADQSFVLVNETYRYQITKVFLTGDRKGEKAIFADGLPSIPDGIARAADGSFWVAMYALRSPVLDALHPYPWVKNQMAKLPSWLLPVPPAYGLIVHFSEQGEVLQSLHDRAAVTVGNVTSVQPEDDGLHLGTLHSGAIGVLRF